MTAQQPPRLLRGIPLVVRKLQKTFGSRQVLREIGRASCRERVFVGV